MNFNEINHCLTTAINNLAEGEIDANALTMAEDLEREDLEEARIARGYNLKLGNKKFEIIRVYKTRDNANNALPLNLVRQIGSDESALILAGHHDNMPYFAVLGTSNEVGKLTPVNLRQLPLALQKIFVKWQRIAAAKNEDVEELEEATKRKNTQRARDRRAFKKYGVKFRTTGSGHKLAINKRGKVAGGNPKVLEKIPAEKKAAPEKKADKKSAATKLRDQLAKAKKKMGKSFNAMLAQ